MVSVRWFRNPLTPLPPAVPWRAVSTLSGPWWFGHWGNPPCLRTGFPDRGALGGFLLGSERRREWPRGGRSRQGSCQRGRALQRFGEGRLAWGPDGFRAAFQSGTGVLPLLGISSTRKARVDRHPSGTRDRHADRPACVSSDLRRGSCPPGCDTGYGWAPIGPLPGSMLDAGSYTPLTQSRNTPDSRDLGSYPAEPSTSSSHLPVSRIKIPKIRQRGGC